MVCGKCGYHDKKELVIFGIPLCRVCSSFAPSKEQEFVNYLSEKIDWKVIDTFRKYAPQKGIRQKEGMSKEAAKGNLVSRPPFGYSLINGVLAPNEESAKVHSLFTTFLSRNYSLNSLSKNFGLSINGTKKILSNRTYLGEIKFDGQIHKGTHNQLISPEIFYAVQRKLKSYLKPRKL